MTEHELTEEKIARAFDETYSHSQYLTWGEVAGDEQDVWRRFARKIHNFGKQATGDGESPGGFLPCTFDEIRKGDTVERTLKYGGVTEVLTGIAGMRDADGDWFTDDRQYLVGSVFPAESLRRKPAEVTPPDPEKHPIILDEYGRPWAWDGDELYKEAGVSSLGIYPAAFGNDWTAAHVVAKEED